MASFSFKTAPEFSFSTILYCLLLPLLVFHYSCQSPQAYEETPMEKSAADPEADVKVVWHVKAIHPDGKFIDVKAIDTDGSILDIKAFESNGQHQVIDLKALKGDERLDVKVLMGEDPYMPVKAIDKDGNVLDIKAMTDEGRLDVKGVRQSGNVIHIKAVTADGEFYGVKAISPNGLLNDVKGVKVMDSDLEETISGVEVRAHIKAVPQDGVLGDNGVWHIKAIHPQGIILDVKALDKEGNIFDVKALQTSDQRQLMDIKVLVDGQYLPVKILAGEENYLPVKAITKEGDLLDIKALSSEGTRLDVKGVKRKGNVIDIKAIDEGNHYGIKALSPDGQLNDVKGVKMTEKDVEANINGVDIFSHVKALPQLE